jgi:hypothetical protein
MPNAKINVKLAKLNLAPTLIREEARDNLEARLGLQPRAHTCAGYGG